MSVRTRVGVVVALALSAVGLAVPAAPVAQAVTSTAFSCTPRFYQVTATGGGAFYEYNTAANSFSQVGTGAVASINGIGYNTADNYIYGVSGTKLYRIDNTGTYSAGTTITGTTIGVGGGDFYNGQLVVAPTSGNGWASVNVTSAAGTAFTMTSAANGNAAGATWGAYDLTVQGNLGYGLNGSTLYIAKMDTKQVSSRTVTGTTTGAYGAAYSDSSGNAFFYNNTDHKVYMFSAAELAKATGSSTAPAAVLVGGAASTPALTAPNDGASCPNAVSPYAPTIVDPAAASAVTTTTATLTGNAIANNASTTVGFCYGTRADLVGCTSAAGSPGTASGTSQTQFTSALTGLSPGTQYWFQIVATNTVGTNRGQVYSFTTTAAARTDQTITFPQPDPMTVGDPNQLLGATASSGLGVAYASTTPLVCSISNGRLVALAAGTCGLTADQAGNATYNAAPQVSRTVTIVAPEVPVLPSDQTIDFPALDGVTLGDPAPVPAATATSGLPVAYGTSTPEVCTWEDGALVLHGAGACTVTADQDGSLLWNPAPTASRTFTVAPAPQTQSIDFPSLGDVTWGEDAPVPAATATSGLPVTYGTSTPEVCTWEDGALVLHTAGTCTVTADQAGDATYAAAAQAEAGFTVLPIPTQVGLGTVATVRVDAGTTSTAVTATRPSETHLDSLTPDVCTVTDDGTITLVSAGECTIHAADAGDATHAASEDTTTFTVLPGLLPQTLSFPALATTTWGEDAPVPAASATSELPVSYGTSTPEVCTWEDGALVLHTSGWCTVTADQAGDATYAAAEQAVATFEVLKAEPSVALTPVQALKVDAGPAHTTVTATRPDATHLSSLTPDVCSATDDGTITLVAPGVCTVEARDEGDDVYLSAHASIDVTVFPALEVSTPDPVETVPGAPVTITVEATGGVGPYWFELTDEPDNALPAGLVLDPLSGAITGTPEAPGTYDFDVTVVDSDGQSVQRHIHLVVARPGGLVAPSGHRRLVAGDRFWLPLDPGAGETWHWTLPRGFTHRVSRDGRLWVTAARTTSGRFPVPLEVSDGSGTALGVFHVTVSPRRVHGVRFSSVGRGARITWTASHNPGVVDHLVTVDGHVVGHARGSRLTVPVLLGPDSVVRVTNLGHDRTSARPTRGRYAADAPVGVAAVVHFATSSSVLDARARGILQRLAVALHRTGLRHVRVAGYTDARGTLAENRVLSTRRAHAVASYLRQRVRGLVLHTSGHSELDPVAPNDNPVGMAHNRRAEVAVW